LAGLLVAVGLAVVLYPGAGADADAIVVPHGDATPAGTRT
jgi:hypothetical protein